MHAVALRYLDQVARQGSIRKAATVLNVASSAVNRQILKLEREIGTPLFERKRNGVWPTAAGETLLRHARETLAEYQRARAEIDGMAGAVSGEVTIISLPSLLLNMVPSVVEEIALRHPRITFNVLAIDPSQIGDELRSGRADLGVLFVDQRLKGIETLDTIHTAIGALMRPDHPLARRRQVTLTDCAAFPVMMLHDRWLLNAIMESEFAQSGARFKPRLVSNSLEFMRSMALAGIGIGFFTPVGFIEEIRSGALVHVPLAEPRLADSAIGIMVPRNKRLSPAARLVIRHIRERLDSFGRELKALKAPAKAVPKRQRAAR